CTCPRRRRVASCEWRAANGKPNPSIGQMLATHGEAMKAYQIRDDFGFDNLVETDRPRPEAGPGEVVMETRAVSPNYRDLLMVRGMYNPNQELPLVPFSDAVGEVVEVGDDVERFETGDRICPIFSRNWVAGEPTLERLKTALGGPLDGTLQEFVKMPARSAVAAPENLSDAEASTLTCAGLTAWYAVTEQGDVQAGDTLATLGTGGVSSFALLFGDALGAEVILTSSSDRKLEQMAERGADHGINYEDNPEWGKDIKAITDGRGADHIVEVGGAETLPQSVKGVCIGGQISLIGVLSGHIEDFAVTPVLMQNIRIQGVLVGNRDMFENMNRAIEANDIHPVVDEVFEFDEVHDALEYMARQTHREHRD
ncbi:MAG: NAD(P)-dependent alcohol dehydrogenase, partial [Bradymonadaceae bacterium]